MTITDCTIKAEATGTNGIAYGAYNYSGTITITGGTITVEATYGTTEFINNDGGSITISDCTIINGSTVSIITGIITFAA